MSMRETRVRRIMVLAGAVVIAALGAWIWLAWDRESFLAWKREAGPAPFFTALAIMPMFGFPTTPFFLMAGATFGVVVGLAGSALSLAVNLALCYWIARSGLRRVLEAWLARTRYELPEVTPGREFQFTLLVKMTPGIPTFIKNYLLGLSGVPFTIYFAVSFTVTLAYAAAFIVLGESMSTHDLGWGAWALAALALLGLALWWFRRRRHR